MASSRSRGRPLSQKRSRVRYATIEEMADRSVASAARAVAALAVVVVFACGLGGVRATAAGWPQQDDEAVEATVHQHQQYTTEEDDAMMTMDLLTVRPDAVAYSARGGAPSPSTAAAAAAVRPGSNIQKVHRTAKAAAVAVAADDGARAPGATYTSDLEWLLNVYNPHRWNPVMLPAASRLSVQCRDVMRVYLEALRRGSFWAAKSEWCTHTQITTI